MEKVRYGIIGLGNQGTLYRRILTEGQIKDGVCASVCDVDGQKRAKHREDFPDIPVYETAGAMFASGNCDVVLIETPHYEHTSLAIEAMAAGLHVVVDKPAGVYTKQVKEMLRAHKEQYPDRMLGIMFNQRTNPVFKKMKEMIAEGKLGEIKRTNWIITDWYRSDAYYGSGSWRATWAGEGGGVLYNQSPHQLDLFSWIVGMQPTKVRAFCHFGKWHDIEVEDDVTAYVEYANGATGTFITCTADAPGTNRFEITGTRGTLIFDRNSLIFRELAMDEREWCHTTDKAFRTPEWTESVIEVEGDNPQHKGILQNVTDTLLGRDTLYAPAEDGLNGVMLANAMHLSAFLDRTVELPIDDELFYEELQKRINKQK